MERSEEIRRLLRLSESEVIERAGERLVVRESLDELYQDFSNHIAELIIINNEAKSHTRIIVPVGPVDQYPILAERINREKIDLSLVKFFFMDEYIGPEGRALPPEHQQHARAKHYCF